MKFVMIFVITAMFVGQAFGGSVKTIARKASDLLAICDPGEKEIIFANRSAWHWKGTSSGGAGATIYWKTSNGESGKFILLSNIDKGKTLPIPISNPAPKDCKGKVFLP